MVVTIGWLDAIKSWAWIHLLSPYKIRGRDLKYKRKSMVKVFIIIFVLICQTVYSLISNETLYNDAVSAFNLIVDETTEQNEKNQAQKEYLRCIQELSINKDDDSIIKILNEQWIKVSIKNEENDWEAKTNFSATIKSLIPKEYSSKTKKVFLYLESFIFNPQFFEYGKKAILSNIIRSGLYENEPDYVVDLIIRMLEDRSLSSDFKVRVLQFGNKKYVRDEYLTIVTDKLGESQHFKDILLALVLNKNELNQLRTKAMHFLAVIDAKEMKYKKEIVKLVNEPENQILNNVARRAVLKYKDPELINNMIDYIHQLIKEETGKEFNDNYALYYECNLTKLNVDKASVDLRFLADAGTDEVVQLFKNIINAGLILDLENNTEYRSYLEDCIKLLGKTENPKAIPFLIDVFDNYSLIVKSGNVEKDRIKQATLIAMSYFKKEEIQNILEPRYKEYMTNYLNLSNKRANDRIEIIINR